LALLLSPAALFVYPIPMPIEPLRSHVSRVQRAAQRNPYEGRWNWWYSSIADIMIRDPSMRLSDIASELNKASNTISMIVNTDLFKDYLARRKEEWRRDHDFVILSKIQRVAELSLESVAQQLEKKKDQVPLNMAVETMVSALDRLGYGAKTQPQVAVNVNQSDNRTQTVIVQGVSASALEEAREALRLAERKSAESYDDRLTRHPTLKLVEPGPLGPSDTRANEADKEPPPLGGGDNSSRRGEASQQIDLFAIDEGEAPPS